MDSEERIGRLVKIMTHVAAHTRDAWARDYLIGRLQDHGFSIPQFVLDSDETTDIDSIRAGQSARRQTLLATNGTTFGAKMVGLTWVGISRAYGRDSRTSLKSTTRRRQPIKPRRSNFYSHTCFNNHKGKTPMPKSKKPNLPKELASEMERLGLSRRDLADASDLTPTAVGNILRGDEPKLSTLRRIASAIGKKLNFAADGKVFR
jgi:lambda repressor-like predicted transcriptional regulator